MDASDRDTDAAIGTDAATLDAAVLQTLEFRQGAGGYAGALDTYLDSDAPGTSFGDADALLFDGEDGDGELFALLQFTEIVGSGGSQIPRNATIESALLRLTVLDASVNPAGSVHMVAVDWDEDTTYGSFGPDSGVDSEDIGPAFAEAPVSGVSTIDVTLSVRSWVNETRENHGWIFVAAEDNNDGVDLASSDNVAEGLRPTLTVTFFAP